MKRKLIYIFIPLIFLLACLGFVACGEEVENLPAQLDTPKNLKIEAGILSWDKVAFADGYRISIGEEEHSTKECLYDLTDLSADKDYMIKVVAYSNREQVAASRYVAIKYTANNILTDRGFAFEQINNTKTYKVTKFAVDKKGACIIPATYNGGLVTKLAPGHDDPSVRQVKSLYLPNTIDPSNYDATKSLASLNFAIKYFSNLESIELEPGSNNSDYGVEGNCLIKLSTHTLLVGCMNCVIPNSVTAIGDFAFGWRNFTEFAVPDFVKKIGGSAFTDCERLTKITLPAGLEQIAAGTFTNCTSLKSIEIPDSVTSLETWAFWKCTSLESIVLPLGLTKLGQGAFDGCSALKEIIIPASVTSLKHGSFRNCTSLTSVVILGAIKIIDFETFTNCTSLKWIVLPESLTSIPYSAFSNCPLEAVYYCGTEAEWGEIDIKDGTNDALLSAARYYYSESRPAQSGNFWHFVGDVPAKW